MASSGHFKFLQLPAEIRLNIYRMVFHDGRVEVGRNVSNPGPTQIITIVGYFPNSSILSTSRTVYAEALPLFHHRAFSKITVWRDPYLPPWSYTALQLSYDVPNHSSLLRFFSRIDASQCLKSLRSIQLPGVIFSKDINDFLPLLKTVELGHVAEKWTDADRYMEFKPKQGASLTDPRDLIAKVKRNHLRLARKKRCLKYHCEQLQHLERGFKLIFNAVVKIRWQAAGMDPWTRYERCRSIRFNWDTEELLDYNIWNTSGGPQIIEPPEWSRVQNGKKMW